MPLECVNSIYFIVRSASKTEIVSDVELKSVKRAVSEIQQRCTLHSAARVNEGVVED